MNFVRLMTLNPGHFHAALVQKEMHPGVSPCVDVYAPLDGDLVAHLQRLANFNTRAGNPTAWEVEVHTGNDPLKRLLQDRPGNVVVLSGCNRGKIDAIKAAVEAGLNVLADKPWIIAGEDLPKLESALNTAESQGLIAYDIMTERYEVTSLLQREFVNTTEVFGAIIPGTQEEPGVFMESKHYLMKLVAGVPNRRPLWFFDITQQGEGLTDVGTHLVDLVPWILFPAQPIDHRKDITMLAGKRWPTVLSATNFEKVTGATVYPTYLGNYVQDDKLNYYCNTLTSYTVRGVHVKLNVLWDFEAAPGAGDTHFAVFRGTQARIEIRQDREQNYRPELYIVPNGPGMVEKVSAAVQQQVETLQAGYSGLSIDHQRAELRITIPEQYRIGHEAHFGEVARQFLGYLKAPATLPAWEKPNMLAKYYVTTKGVELAH